jgi:hypothetical protein
MTREDILEAAAQVFRQKGFHGASMKDIAEAVNLQKAVSPCFLQAGDPACSARPCPRAPL